MVHVSEETAAWVRAELGGFDDQECVPFRRDQFVSSLVVDLSLFPPMDSGHGGAVCLVEERGRLVMLQLAVLDDESTGGPVSVDW
jgi:hypothetical protein